MSQQEAPHQGGPAQSLSLIRKLTTEKAVKAHRQQTSARDSSSEDDITNIKLSSRGIKTIESLDLPSLRRLDLSNNSLNRLKGLQGCPQVTYLTAAGNELTGEGLDGVRALKDLKVLNASGNRVRRVPPAVFSQFRQLQALVLNNNEISEVPPTWLKKGLLPLNTLVLSHNKVKSLSDSGLGRLTALTKLSVSHNTLVELPDLSACTGLEELRAAHNLISQVPASLSKNVSLRTLDLGHNRIDEWVGLERLGSSLKSLVQLSLAGNPLCTSPSTTALEQKQVDGEGEGECGGEYIGKVRSLFPSLKVRDGKRILMKKSHTYYETRGAEEGGGAAKDASGPRGRGKPGLPPSPGRRAQLDARPGGDGRRKVEVEDEEGQRKNKGTKTPKLKEVRAGKGMQGSPAFCAGVVEEDEEDEGTEEAVGKAARRLKKKAARAAAAAAQLAAESEGKPDKKTVKKRRRQAEEEAERSSRPPVETAAAAASSNDFGKSRRKQRRQAGEAAADSAAETSASCTEGATSVSKQKDDEGETKTNEQKAKKRHHNEPSSVGESIAHRQEDPYSSSEELVIPGRRPKESATARAVAVGGDRESGVLSVVINKNNKKRKGAVGGATNPWQGGEAPGRAEGGEFSFDAILEARSEKETIGLGSGISAWDT
eukprot:g12905.t1